MLGSEKSSCVKLNISSAASSVETKSIPQMLELIAGETSEYPSGAVRVAGSFVDVKPNYASNGVTSFTVIGKTGK
jgi:hypothetical protein